MPQSQSFETDNEINVNIYSLNTKQTQVFGSTYS